MPAVRCWPLRSIQLMIGEPRSRYSALQLSPCHTLLRSHGVTCREWDLWAGQLTWNERDVSALLCILGLMIWACLWATAHTKCIGHVIGSCKTYKFPTCRPINGLSILWSMGWGCCSLNALILKLIVACRIQVVREDHNSNVYVMIVRLIWITWTALSAIRESPLNIITHTFGKVRSKWIPPIIIACGGEKACFEGSHLQMVFFFLCISEDSTRAQNYHWIF